ncbi:MAG TPA: protein kinase [Pyrinomonadaceae bacterium]
MEVKDWQHVESLFHAALGLRAGERAALLARECAGDAALRGEVESLLAAFEGHRDLLEEPAFSLGLKVMSEDAVSASLVGMQVGPYKLMEALGRGGMGEVYLAEDTRLGRKVALKSLSGRLVGDNWARRQLIREAQAVAMLDHPNICAVHGIEEQDGHSFIIMQYVEGENLSRLISERPPDAKRALALALQVVGALAEAHAHGIIHRDIKPQNVMVNADGQAKVLDFGLAKLVRPQSALGAVDSPSQASQSGLVMGTVAYMSPEQLRAERLDFRSDIFSLGTVLYELLSGKNPFARTSDAETISAILTCRPAPLTQATSEVSPELSRIVLKCLEKDREQRYHSASELLYELSNLQTAGHTAPRGRAHFARPHFTSRATRAAAAIFLLVLLVSTFLWLSYARLTRVQNLAVLPIVNESGDASFDYLGDGLTESLIKKLSGLSKLRIKAFTTVAVYRGREFDPRQVGRELRVDAVLMGRLVRQGESLVLQTRLVDAANGSQLWDAKYDVRLEQVFELQNQISENVAAGLELRLGLEEKNSLAAHRASPEAFNHYMLGRYYWNNRNPENIQRAIKHFEEAFVLEANYAEAHAGLADCYVFLASAAYGEMTTADAMRKAKGAANLALKIDERLPEAHTSVGVVQLRYDWTWDEAEREFKRAIELNPDYAPAHYWYSNLLAITGRLEDAIAESERAKALDPSSPSVSLNRCRAFFLARQHDRAAACFNEMLDKEPGNERVQYILGLVYQQKGMYEEAIKIHEKIAETNLRLAAGALGYSYGRTGRREEALKMLDKINELSKQKTVPVMETAIIYVGLGDKNNAFAWLEKAYEERFASLTYLAVEPLFDSLRADARYHSLLRRLNLPPAR